MTVGLLIFEISFESLGITTGRRTIEEKNTQKYTKPIQFTPQTSTTTTDPSSTSVKPNSVEFKQENLTPVQSIGKPSTVHQNPSRKRKLESSRRNDQLSGFCRKTLRPNKHENFILMEMGTYGGETNSFQILQTSAAKQRATVNLTYSMIGNETYGQNV